ncbi:uncharacterized protein [Anabrus simplex]|uniref:uncharacterized protein n=1 Tax=Anabrus simplex TaxID=316456 RepID=UPI0035A27584
MDFEVKIKEEPVSFEETSNSSCDNYNIISEEMHLKEEPKSELAEARETQVNTFEPSTNIKDEICVDEHTVGQLVACFKEEDSLKYVKHKQAVLATVAALDPPIVCAMQVGFIPLEQQQATCSDMGLGSHCLPGSWPASLHSSLSQFVVLMVVVV